MSKKPTVRDEIKELQQEIDVLDHMLSALVETLEEKGVLTQEEWEQKIKAKIEKASQSYRELEPE
jgi:DNA-binding HxlR family transcriptional regulator